MPPSSRRNPLRRQMLLALLLSLLMVLSSAQQQPSTPVPDVPKLSGQHFRITVIVQKNFVNGDWNEKTGKMEYSGYLIDVLDEISREDRGNFTYELLPPSGFGSGCLDRLEWNMNPNNSSNITNDDDNNLNHPDAYHPRYKSQYKCGESDVNDRPLTSRSTDMFWGDYYITPARLLVNKFTVPYIPPVSGTLAMMGYVTDIRDLADLAVNFSTTAVCAYAGTAYHDILVQSFPQLDIKGIFYDSKTYDVFADGTCEIIITSGLEIKNEVLNYQKEGTCKVNGLPLGMIGDPLDYGLNHFAFGIRNDLPDQVLDTINYWLLSLMACFPDDSSGACPRDNGGGSLSELWGDAAGTGSECGYIQFPPGPPPEPRKLSNGAIVAIAVTPVIVAVALCMVWNAYRLKEQEQRMKKRFIQQLARNVEIGEDARCIPADKLAEAFHHIGGEDGHICKTDLAKWINDLHMDFMSEKDFDRLWDAMDLDHTGTIDPIDFFAFLAECGPQFKEVHQEYSALPKSERQKLAARRLSTISGMGEEEVSKMERRNNRRQRLNAHSGGMNISSPNLVEQAHSSRRTSLFSLGSFAPSRLSTFRKDGSSSRSSRFNR